MVSEPAPAVVQLLVDNHARFLAFLERRTGTREDAEDVLQNAFVRALERGAGLKSRESAVAWFYRLLRNALVDRQRGSAAAERAAEPGLRADAWESAGADAPLHEEVCRCVADLLPTLKPEYAELIRRVDLDGVAVVEAARALGITPNHAGVRLHRARKALLREVRLSCGTCATHGCFDCSCGRPG